MARAMLAACVLLATTPVRAQEETIDVLVPGDTAPGIESERDRTPPVYVLRRPALDPPGRTLADALASVPGVEVRRSGGGADLATASLRGATSAQTPVYLAGIRLNDELTGTADLSTLPTWMLHRIESYRGHAPIGVDELGMGGAILLEPRLADAGGRAAVGFGSFGEREARAALAPARGALAGVRYATASGDYAFVDDRGTRFDASDDIERRRENGDHEEIDAWAVARMQSGASRLTTLVNVYAREAGAPGLQVPGAREARASRARLLAGAAGDLACGERCAVDIGSDVLLSRYALRDPLRELGGARLTENDGGRIGQRLGVRFAVLEWLELGLRGSLRTSQLAVDADRSALVRAERHLVRSEIDAMVSILERADLALVTALECHSTTGAETCGTLEPVGRLGGRVRLVEPLALMANAGRYVRVPTLGELYGVSATVMGNAALATETGWSFDVGLAARWRRSALATYAQLVGFARLADALIAYRRSSLGAVRPYNAASARVLGLELAAGGLFWRILRLGMALTVLDPRDVSDNRGVANDLLPYEARLVVAPEIELLSPGWRAIALDRASLALRYRHRSERVADPAGLIVLPGEHQLDVDGALMFAQHLGLRGRIANVLDRRSFDLVGYPLPGRSYHVLLEAWW